MSLPAPLLKNSGPAGLAASLSVVCRGQALHVKHAERSLQGWAQRRDARLTRSSRNAVVDCGEPSRLDLIRWSRFTRSNAWPAVDRRLTVRLDWFAALCDVLHSWLESCSDFDHRHGYGNRIQNKLLHAQR